MIAAIKKKPQQTPDEPFYFASGIYQQVRNTDRLSVSHLFAMPTSALLEPGLSATEKAILAYLYAWSQSGEPDPPRQLRIVDDLRITRRTYQPYLAKLRDKGYVRTEQQRVDDGGGFADFGLNQYWLLPVVDKAMRSKQQLTFVPRTVITGSLPVKVKAFYLLVAALAGEKEEIAIPKDTLMHLAKVSEVTYYRYLTALKEAEVLEVIQPARIRLEHNTFKLFRLGAF